MLLFNYDMSKHLTFNSDISKEQRKAEVLIEQLLNTNLSDGYQQKEVLDKFTWSLLTGGCKKHKFQKPN